MLNISKARRGVKTLFPWGAVGLVIWIISSCTCVTCSYQERLFVGYSIHESACGDCVGRDQ